MEDDMELREAPAEYVVSRPRPAKGMGFEEFLARGNEDTWAEWADGRREQLPQEVRAARQ